MRFFQIVICFYILCWRLGCAQDSLVLYTKTGCSNCAFAKSTLIANNVRFKEYNVDKTSNAKAMLNTLSKKKYKGTIYMPVILYNDTLQYPALFKADTFINISLQTIIQKLSATNSLKDFSLKSEKTNAFPVVSDCEFSIPQHDSIHYLVCGNFNSRSDAEHFMQVLAIDGFSEPTIVIWQNLYRVAIKKASEKTLLLPFYKNILDRYRGAYILSLPNE